MNCKDFEMLMADALGDELAAADRPTFDAHLAECDTCRHDYETARKAIAEMRTLPGPERVTVRREGDRLVIQGAPAGPPRKRWWLTSGVFRYAAGLLIAFTAGYGLHAGLMVRELVRPGTAGSGGAPAPVISARDDNLQAALVSAHQKNPTRSDLAKCLIAMFPAKQKG